MSAPDRTEDWPAPRATAPVRATVSLPGSKSLTNRYLVLAALASGPSRLHRPLRSRDTLLMASALSGLGVQVADAGADWVITPARLRGPATVDTGLAGTVMRFLPAVAALADGEIRFDGDAQARSRPMGPVLQALRRLGADITDSGTPTLPFVVRGTGGLRGGEVTMDASASSQFVSGLLLAGARFADGVTVHHEGPPVPSEPHIAMTVEVLRDSGVLVEDLPQDTWRVHPGSIHPVDVEVEPDLSNAAPFLAAALVTGGQVTVPGWPERTTQAGDAVRDILDAMGADVSFGTQGLTVRGTGEISGLDVDLHDAGELTPVVVALAALADSPSWIRGIAHLRGHETDRLAALAKEINGLGGTVTETDDGLRITPKPLQGGLFATYADHRMAMAGAVLGPGRRRAARRGHRDDGQDAARLPRPLAADARRLVTPRRTSDYDEDDVRVRPNPRGSRPRSKDRPRHEDAVPGFVVGVDRGRYTVTVGEGRSAHDVTAMKARELGRKGVVVGDRVRLVGDTAGGPDELARVVRVEPRASVLRRTADDTDDVERIIVANADQLVVVTSLDDPPPRPRLIDRALVAAYDAGLDPLLALTKADLTEPAQFLASYAPLDVPYVVTRRRSTTIEGLDALRERLQGRVSVLLGHSGVGKSTLVNALVPGALRATGVVNDVTGRGRHTSTSAVALRLPGGAGWVVDTPGIRSFGLAHVDLARIINHFPDLEPGTGQCPRGCTHDEPDCALDEWVDSGRAGPAGRSRLDSLRRLLRARNGTADE